MNIIPIIAGVIGANAAMVARNAKPNKKPIKVSLFFICWLCFLLGIAIGLFLINLFGWY